jgi:AcrR family transcriptional regulator
VNPRKEAVQERSRATVDAILRAATRILVRHGYEGATTNHIAQAAGVSIGSLYQYFPNKEAIVAALLDRHVDEMMQWLRQAAVVAMDQPLEEAARTVIEGFIAVHRVDPELHRVLAEELPRIGGFEQIHRIEDETLTLVRRYLEVRAPHLKKTRRLDLVCFNVVHTVEALAHGAVLLRPELLEDSRFIDEVVQLVVRYVEE